MAFVVSTCQQVNFFVSRAVNVSIMIIITNIMLDLSTNFFGASDWEFVGYEFVSFLNTDVHGFSTNSEEPAGLAY